MNCLIIDAKKKSRTPLERIISGCQQLTLVASCSSAAQAAEQCQKNKIEIIFIDDHIPAIKDIRLLYHLKYKKPRIIMISESIENAKASLDSLATDILLKPVSCSRLMKVINRVILDEKNKDGSSLIVKVDRAFEKISIANIIYIQAMSDYVRIHTPSKVYTTYCTMKAMETKLPQKDFLRVHRSFIVRVENISEFQEGFLSVSQRLIPIGKLYKNQLIERLNVI